MPQERPGIRDRIEDGVFGGVFLTLATPIGPLGCVLGAAAWAFANGSPLPDVLVAGAVGAVVAVVTGLAAFVAVFINMDGGDTWVHRRWAPLAWIALLTGPILLSVATVLALCDQLSAIAGERLLIGVLVVGGVLAIGALAFRLGERAAPVSDPVSEADAEAARQVRWLQIREAEAAADPELAAALRAHGWRPDGPYEEMHAAYFRAWDEVRSARRASGRPVFRPTEGWSDPAAGDPPPVP